MRKSVIFEEKYRETILESGVGQELLDVTTNHKNKTNQTNDMVHEGKNDNQSLEN